MVQDLLPTLSPTNCIRAVKKEKYKTLYTIQGCDI